MLGNLSGATRLFPIIGDPIKYVESPMRLTRTFEERNYNGICVPMQVAADDIDAVMAGLTASRNVDGILVTMPHKFTAFAHCATMEKKGLDPVWNRVEPTAAGSATRLALPNDYKQYQTAKDAFLNAFLRRVSGATVHDAEYYREEKVYFPQPGDDAKRIEYKRQLRDDAIMRMKQQVGPGYRAPPTPPSKKVVAPADTGGLRRYPKASISSSEIAHADRNQRQGGHRLP